MNTAATPNKTFKHYAVLAVFVVSMVAAQFAALQHSIHHPFHEHTHLCDSFIGFDHNSNSLTHSNSLLVAFENISTTYAAEIHAACYSSPRW